MTIGAISLSAPIWYDGISYFPLAPSWELLNKYKQDHNEKEYTEVFNNQLNRLNAEEIYKDFMGMLEINNMLEADYRKDNVVLLCWESPEKFCHRHLVGDWLSNSLGIEIREIE